MEERLQKFLANQGVCSRRKAEEYILAGKVKVNGKVVTELGTKINPNKDKIVDYSIFFYHYRSWNYTYSINFGTYG